MVNRSESPIIRIMRAPVFLFALLLSAVPVFFIFASVSVGSWAEDGLRWFGYRSRPRWLPAVLGFVGYTGFGVAAPAILGRLLIGWPGAILGPVLALGAIALLGRW
jgi:hypothetical protein